MNIQEKDELYKVIQHLKERNEMLVLEKYQKDETNLKLQIEKDLLESNNKELLDLLVDYKTHHKKEIKNNALVHEEEENIERSKKKDTVIDVFLIGVIILYIIFQIYIIL